MTVDYDSLLFMLRPLNGVEIEKSEGTHNYYLYVKFPNSIKRTRFAFDTFGKLLGVKAIDED